MRLIRKTLVILLTFVMLFALIPNFAPIAMASEVEIPITNAISAADIQNAIQDAIDNASSGDIITVVGSKTNENAMISLGIPAGVTVVWKAVSKDLSFFTQNGGTFEVATGGIIEVTGKNAVWAYTGDVIVSGGEVSVLRGDDTDWDGRRAVAVTTGNVTVTGGKVSTFRNSAAIYVYQGNTTVSGGVVSATGETVSGIDTTYCYGIQVGYDGAVAVTGGIVSASGAVTENYAINMYLGLGAYYQGTCVGDFNIGYSSYYGTIVEVDSFDIPLEYHTTTYGLTTVAGGTPADYAKWDTLGGITSIVYESYLGFASYSASWPGVPTPPPIPVAFPVRLTNTGGAFATLSEAIAQANSLGLSTFTLEIIGDVTETNNVIISTENITIVGAGGKHTITMASGLRFAVDGGGSLTLGNGTTANNLTILHSISVTDGTIHVNDGIILKASTTLSLNGSNANGTITGGRFEGSTTAVSMTNGSQMQEISGGEFVSEQYAVAISGTGTRIREISGGSFYQLDPNATGHAVYVGTNSQIDEISGGYFKALHGSALWITRGAWVSEISGGVFEVTRSGVQSSIPGEDTRNAAIWIESENDVTTGIGTISGGEINGTNFGVLLIQWYNSDTGALINYITGGTFRADIPLQNDVGSDIDEIIGGQFIGNQGIFNAGRIKLIGGDVDINGTSSGIINYRTFVDGQIDEISGGRIVGENSTGGGNGISNLGNIDLISGGTIIGGRSAIESAGFNPGKIGTITGGVFWGKNGPAINLAVGYPLTVEPGLTTEVKGFARYWGYNGDIFNDESLAIYPGAYFMSTSTESVPGITETKFKYLTLASLSAVEVTFDSNGGAFGGGWITDTRLLEAGNSLGTDMPDAPIRTGYAFKEWNTAADGSGTEFTGSTVVNSDITVYAQWIPTYEVIVIDSYAAVNGTGNYTEGTLVTIDAGIRSGYTFAGWTVDMGTAVLADASDAITTFLMPNEDVTVTAQWTQNTYEVTVIGSYAAVNGTGTYTEGTLVTIDAGSRSGYTFNGWIVNAGAATLANANNAITTFTMPAENVTVTAQWRNNGGTGGGGNGGGTIVNPGKPVVPPEKPDPPDPPEPPARIIIVLLYMWAVAAFVYNKYREFEIEKENKK